MTPQDEISVDVVDDLSTLVKRLAHALRKAAPDNELSEKALDYLKRNSLAGSPFRRLQEVEAELEKCRRDAFDVVFDGPPSHESGRFVEVEDMYGCSINIGEWIHRPDGFWALRITIPRGRSIAAISAGEVKDG